MNGDDRSLQRKLRYVSARILIVVSPCDTGGKQKMGIIGPLIVHLIAESCKDPIKKNHHDNNHLRSKLRRFY